MSEINASAIIAASITAAIKIAIDVLAMSGHEVTPEEIEFARSMSLGTILGIEQTEASQEKRENAIAAGGK